ncbi:MAG: alpha-hydroxy acid oxidase [Pseudomonadota bacterium]
MSSARTARRMAEAINIADLATLAHKRLPNVIRDYLEGGAEDEVTLRANRSAFDRYRFRPRLATGNGKRDLTVSLFGHTLSTPFMIGPTGLNGIYIPDADLMLARAAAAAGTAFALSSAANNSIETVGKEAPGMRFFQIYPWGDRAVSARLLERAHASGYDGLIVTVDSLIPANRDRDTRNGFAHALHLTPRTMWDGVTHPRWLTSTWFARGMPRFENVAEFVPPGSDAYALSAFTRNQRNPFYSWQDIAWMRETWKGPMLIKGVLTADDARLAVAHGLDGVVVSNHGGRALDQAPATFDVLPEIVEAAGAMPVLVDGGFRRGTDIVKALALGARCVLLGRATLYGVAAGGEAGAARALAILRDETDRVMGLLGCASVAELGPHCLQLNAG